MTSLHTIFPTLSMDRQAIRWEKHLDALTPWESRAGIWFKREDYFAPLGYGGPNGSKMRQLIWYVSRNRGGKERIVTGASIQSPQLSMSAIVGSHYRLPTLEVVYSRPETLMRHPNPRIAAGFGATFEYAKGPYNPIIQSRVRELLTDVSLLVPYGISLPDDSPTKELRAFHATGGHQVSNIPPEVSTLIVPAGSCNTLCSVLLGLSEHSSGVENLLTIGIGPDKRAWLRARLVGMGVDLGALPFRWIHYSLHDTGYSSYSDQFRGEAWDGVEFHPTYEAKVWRWLRENAPIRQDGRTALWIVGSAPDPKVVEPFFTSKLEAA